MANWGIGELLIVFMNKTRPISKTITTLADLEQRFNLSPTTDDQFFPEWQQNLPDLTPVELLLRNTFWNPYPAGLSGNLENVFLSYVASGDV